MVTKHVYISGKVQGVYFRDYTRKKALALEVSGWVRNLPDGRVEAVFQGDEDKVKAMLEWCWEGSPRSQVKDMQVEDLETAENYTGFRITG